MNGLESNKYYSITIYVEIKREHWLIGDAVSDEALSVGVQEAARYTKDLSTCGNCISANIAAVAPIVD